MLMIHHLEISQSERVVWAAEELSLPYDIKLYRRMPGTRLAPPEYKALHPFQSAPVITDGTVTLAESGAIVEYLVRKYGGGRFEAAPDSAHFSEYLFWLHFANASFMPIFGREMLIALAPALDGHGMVREMRTRLTRGLTMIEERLGAGEYFGGPEFTAADIMMVFPLTTMRHYVPLDLSPYPNLKAYLARIGARPAYRRMLEKAEPVFRPTLD